LQIFFHKSYHHILPNFASIVLQPNLGQYYLYIPSPLITYP
jgi:hypothetical protein